MRCSCGKPGNIRIARRETPYCEECFKQHIARCVRREAPERIVKLKLVPGYFLDAAKAVCALADRTIELADDGFTPGCAESAAAAKLKHYFGYTAENERIFPSSITLQELQTFFKAEAAVLLDSITEELQELEKKHPGTINSIKAW